MKKEYNFSDSKKNPYARLLKKLVTIKVYINQEQIRSLKLKAKKENVTVSELIREAINNLLVKKTKKIKWDNNPLTKAIGTSQLDVTDVPARHDFYLYDKKKD